MRSLSENDKFEITVSTCGLRIIRPDDPFLPNFDSQRIKNIENGKPFPNLVVKCGRNIDPLEVLLFLMKNRNFIKFFSAYILPTHPNEIVIEGTNSPNDILMFFRKSEMLKEKDVKEYSYQDAVSYFCSFTYCSRLFGQERIVKLYNANLNKLYKGDAAQVLDVDLREGKAYVQFLPRIDYSQIGNRNVISEKQALFMPQRVDDCQNVQVKLSFNSSNTFPGYKWNGSTYCNGFEILKLEVSSLRTWSCDKHYTNEELTLLIKNTEKQQQSPLLKEVNSTQREDASNNNDSKEQTKVATEKGNKEVERKNTESKEIDVNKLKAENAILDYKIKEQQNTIEVLRKSNKYLNKQLEKEEDLKAEKDVLISKIKENHAVEIETINQQNSRRILELQGELDKAKSDLEASKAKATKYKEKYKEQKEKNKEMQEQRKDTPDNEKQKKPNKATNVTYKAGDCVTTKSIQDISCVVHSTNVDTLSLIPLPVKFEVSPADVDKCSRPADEDLISIGDLINAPHLGLSIESVNKRQISKNRIKPIPDRSLSQVVETPVQRKLEPWMKIENALIKTPDRKEAVVTRIDDDTVFCSMVKTKEDKDYPLDSVQPVKAKEGSYIYDYQRKIYGRIVSSDFAGNFIIRSDGHLANCNSNFVVVVKPKSADDS